MVNLLPLFSKTLTLNDAIVIGFWFIGFSVVMLFVGCLFLKIIEFIVDIFESTQRKRNVRALNNSKT